MAALTFTVQQIGNYSYLTLENLAVTGNAAASSGAAPPPPPLSQAVLGNPVTSRRTSQARTGEEQAAAVLSPGWAGWVIGINNRVNQAAPAAQVVVIEAPSVDETDVDWHAWLSGSMGAATPATFTPTFTPFQSRYGRAFAVNDYALIADAASYVDSSGVTRYRFEIVQIAAISNAGAWTVNRAQFGTPLIAHTPAMGPIAVYRLIDAVWAVTLPASAPQVKKLAWDSMCVAAIQASVNGASPALVNLIPPVASGVPAVPGFRTLAGAEYTLGAPGLIALGATSVLRLSVAGWHSIRNMFFEMDGAAGSGAATNITLVYISPDRAHAYQVAAFSIPAGARTSYSAAQQNTRMPANAAWPPHTNLPLMTGALSSAGVLQNGFTLNPAITGTISEDGELDFIVTQNAATPGNGLRGVIQT